MKYIYKLSQDLDIGMGTYVSIYLKLKGFGQRFGKRFLVETF